MRYVIVGPGGIGSALGGRLHQSGHDVVFVARGANYDALVANGLRLVSPTSDDTFPVNVVATLDGFDLAPDDVVLLAVKSQDSATVLADLAAAAPTSVAVVCTQNGVFTEAAAHRYFESVYGAYNFLITSYYMPGVAHVHTSPYWGVIDVGLASGGEDDVSRAVAAHLRDASFDSMSRPDVMRWKYAKLLTNLGNAFQAASGYTPQIGELIGLAQAEGVDCFEAAGIDFVPDADEGARRDHLLPMQAAGGLANVGGSSWQSLARGTGAVETYFLNGEISMLGRHFGVPTPVNDAITRIVVNMARTQTPPGSITPTDLLTVVAESR